MRVPEIAFLFAYDRWATRRILNVAEGLDEEAWSRPALVGDRGIAGVLIHALGAHGRWRSAWQGSDEKPRPELEPLLTPRALRDRWEAEWDALDAYLAAITDEVVTAPWDGVPLWQPMAHVVNHGTQHRSEAAALLTAAGRSPGDLDLIDFVEERANQS